VPPPPRLLDRVRSLLRTRHYSLRTERTYLEWIRRYILFHEKRHPTTLGPAHLEAFLTYLAVEREVAASTQNQALSAVLFLYRQVLGRKDFQTSQDGLWARRPRRLPTVLSPAEVARLLGALPTAFGLFGRLLYGSGLRLMEALRLRVKDLDFDMLQIMVRDAKGENERATILPASLVPDLRRQLHIVHLIHEQDLAQGHGRVYLPHGLERKYPSASEERMWQYVFPARELSLDPRSSLLRRHHLDPGSIQKAVRQAAARAGLDKHVTPHTLRHCFATHLLANGYDIRTVQELLGHKDVKTTMIHTHVLQRGGYAGKSPLDGIPPRPPRAEEKPT
jgi:integron integrase